MSKPRSGWLGHCVPGAAGGAECRGPAGPKVTGGPFDPFLILPTAKCMADERHGATRGVTFFRACGRAAGAWSRPCTAEMPEVGCPGRPARQGESDVSKPWPRTRIWHVPNLPRARLIRPAWLHLRVGKSPAPGSNPNCKIATWVPSRNWMENHNGFDMTGGSRGPRGCPSHSCQGEPWQAIDVPGGGLGT